MNSIRKLALGLALTLGLSAAAHAAPVSGTGGGYYGSAWYGSNQGSVVGPYSTWSQCNAALQAAINNAVNNFGWTVTEINYCSYRPPFVAVVDDLPGLAVSGGSPRESLADATALLQELAQLRTRYGTDAYEAELRAISKASAGK